MNRNQNLSVWYIAAIVALAGLTTTVTSARAERTPERLACDGSEPQYTLDEQIAGCTAVIDGGNVSNEDLASAFENRGLTYYLKGQKERAIEDFGRAITLKADYKEAFLARSAAYSATGQYDRGIEDATRAIALQSDYADAFVNRGNGYYGKGQYDLAIADYQQALKLNPNVANAAAYLRRTQDAKAKAAPH